MRLSTRTGLITLVSTVAAIGLVSVTTGVLYRNSLYERVDQQLVERSANAPVIAAVGERVSVSELSTTVAGVRVATDGRTFSLGRLPDEPLPPIATPGFRTARADGEDWRLFGVEVDDLPNLGDRTLVEFVEPLGDVQAQGRLLRRRMITVGALTAVVVGVLGWFAGRRATRPLSQLAADASLIGADEGAMWSVSSASGSPEVDEVAVALNRNLERLRAETARREDALAAARSFASSASHELRTPLQSAMTNLDVALADPGGPVPAGVTVARAELARMAASLSAVRALTEVDLIGADDIAVGELGAAVDEAVASVPVRASGDHRIDFRPGDDVPVAMWADGVRLAVANLVRNALVHGGRPDGGPTTVTVSVLAPGVVVVDDDGAGIDPAERERLIRPYERGTTERDGSGLGLSFCDRVARVHGGELLLDRSPTGGLRASLWLVRRDASTALPTD